MMIAIPLDESKQAISASFGRAPYFLFHNTETNTSEMVLNTAAQAQGGAGIKAAQLIADRTADALITPRCGQNAAEVLLSAGILIYKAGQASVFENVKALTEGKLGKLDTFYPGFHGSV
ncbi:MAG: NifB/NifX family molybdenum-iron cluster-binding protein [Bacillota bacterium]